MPIASGTAIATSWPVIGPWVRSFIRLPSIPLDATLDEAGGACHGIGGPRPPIPGDWPHLAIGGQLRPRERIRPAPGRRTGRRPYRRRRPRGHQLLPPAE